MRSSVQGRLSLIAGALVTLGLAFSSGVCRAETQTVTSVEVQEDEGLTRVVLRGARDPIYTAFLREDPPRLIVELSEVTFEGIGTPIEVGNGLVREVSLGAFGDPSVSLSMARVSIALDQLAEYQLVPSGDELAIEIRPGASQPGEPAVAGDEVPAAPAVVEKSSTSGPAALDETSPTRSAEPARAAATAPKAAAKAAAGRRGPAVTAVRADARVLDIATSAEVKDIQAFTLENPARLVVDLLGARRGNVASKLEVAQGKVERVRIGSHADKVRIVVDLREPLTAHRIEPGATRARVWLDDAIADAGDAGDPGGQAERRSGAEPEEERVAVPGAKPKLASRVPEASADIEAATPTNLARVSSAHFESLPQLDRVVVTLSRSVAAELVEPDPGTLIVRLPLSEVDANVERRVDTREFGGPVEIFSVFQTPDVSPGEVRVVLKRQPDAKASLSWEKGQLFVELPRITSFSATAGPRDERAVALTPDGVPLPASSASAADVPASRDGAPLLESSEAFQDPFAFDGPSDPASIDILEEGGFSEQKEYVGRRVSLDFKDADIGNILRLIAEVSDLNVIAGEEVSGTVTIRLVDVPWDQALDVILLTKGLGFVRVGNVLRIAPLEAIKLEAEQRLQERRAKEKLEDLIVKLQPVNYADVDDVKTLIKRLLSKRGSVDVDQRTNTLIIKDIPSVVQEATALVKAIDTQTPQVLIEAKIVEANLTFSRSLGTVWGLGYTPGQARSGNEDFAFGNARDNLLTGDTQANNFITSLPNTAAGVAGLLNLGILSLDDRLQLDLQLQAAENNDKGKVISSPRVVTIDNKEAIIKQGVAIAFTEATADRITTSFIDAVLELKVKPHITADRSIIMDIKVSRNAPQLSASTGAIAGIAKNETQTEALVRDGETIVLGGIYVVDSGRQNTKVPFLADLPLIGVAFRNNTIADERRELLIFVTPRVILGRPSDA